MAFGLNNRTTKKRTGQIVGIDLGGRTTKAVLIQSKGEGYSFLNYTIQDAPIYEKNITADLLGEHLKSVLNKLSCKTRKVNLTISGNDSIVRVVDLPQMAVSDMRLMLKHGSKTYLQQDLPDYVFDCYVIPSQFVPLKQVESEKKASAQKLRVVVGGAKRSFVDEFQAGAKIAGITIENLVPEIICPINAFEYAQPEIFQNSVVALVDIGFKNCSISILVKGELVLNRMVNMGGDKLTSSLAESMGITYAEAESIKIGMPEEVSSNLEQFVIPLGRELRASLDFCEHQFDVTVEHVFVSGGSARSEFILKCLQNELIAQCKLWNPTSFMELRLPPQLIGECEYVAPQLAVAVGAAVCSF
ncbi:MAG: pilus assembly protein PilM [Verrucomicrobiae bacterium]|nr:pilus assembly protein PilM [Verrucomicrobiae bacterium]